MLQIKKYHNSYNRTFAETTKLPYNCYRNNETEAFSMKIKSKKKYLTVTKEDVSKFIEYILIARNAYRLAFLAEAVGFEPTGAFTRLPDFESGISYSPSAGESPF